MKIWSRQAFKMGLIVCLTAFRSFAAPGVCGKASDYDGYKVLEVDIKNPLGFIRPWSNLSKTLEPGLKVKANSAFSWQNFQQDSAYLGAKLKQEFSSSQQRFKLSFAGGEIEDCDPDARTLRVVYPIITTVIPTYLSPTIEQQSAESNRPATTGGSRTSYDSMQAAPLIGYNQTRGTFVGLNFSDISGNIHMQGETEDSANSRLGHLNLSSTEGPVKNLWNKATYVVGFEYEDTPAGTSRFKEGKLAARFSASTKETTAGHILFRYGASLEGGHQQSSDTAVTSDLVPNSSYGTIKMYAGLTGRPENSAFTASYGLQLGSTFTTGVPIFKKQIVDLGYNRNIWLTSRKPAGDRGDFQSPLEQGVHRSLDLQTRFTAGLIQDAAGAPLAERFLGGNEVHPFVQDDSWLIQGDAYIRSIPENTLGTQSAAALGGSRFYSVNATLSFTAWGKPLIPKELGDESEFPGVLNAGFQTAVTAMANRLKIDDPAYQKVAAAVPMKAQQLKEKLTALSNLIASIPLAIAGSPDAAKLLKAIHSNLVNTRGAASLIASSADPQVMGELETNWIPALSGLITELTTTLRNNSQSDVAAQMDALMNDIKPLGHDIDAPNDLPSAQYEDQAWRKLATAHRAVDTLLNRLNIVSISPVAIFDVAHVWPVNEGVRYGVGPGLRLSLVNANFTFGYALNPQRTGSEKVGAIFFKLDITSLF